jgi:hypothetical protein
VGLNFLDLAAVNKHDFRIERQQENMSRCRSPSTEHRSVIQLLRRPKQNGAAYHFAVQLPNESIIELMALGIRICNLKDSGGQEFQVLRIFSDALLPSLLQRLDHAMRTERRYHLLRWNCESFAYWLVGEDPQSKQIRDFAIIVGVIGLVVAVNRGLRG